MIRDRVSAPEPSAGVRRDSVLRNRLVAVLAMVLCASQAIGQTLIDLPGRRCHVHDAGRDLLYVSTSDGKVERYDIAGRTLLAPFAVGVELTGCDTTPDGGTLYVGEARTTEAVGTLYEVDLETGAVTPIPYVLDGGEAGVWNVAIGPLGKGLVTTEYAGSGDTPLREIDTATGVLTIRGDAPDGDVEQRTHIGRSLDRSLFLLLGSNSSAGPFFTYDPLTDSFPTSGDASFSLSRVSPAVSPDGSMVASVSDVLALARADLTPVFNLTRAEGGVAFDPVRAVVYVVDAESDELVGFDLASPPTWRSSFRASIGEDLDGYDAAPLGDGEITVTEDGRWAFVSTPAGIRRIDLCDATRNAPSDPCRALFEDGFETGTVDGWSAAVGES